MVISQEDSKTIGFLRFTLTFLIVFGHMNPNTISIQETVFSLLSGQGISNAIAVGLSYLLAHAAVPVYFLMSGYLFWAGIKEWDWNVFAKKIKSRGKSLLLPYLLWNLLSILSFVVVMFIQDIKNNIPFDNVLEYIQSIGIRGFWDYCIWGQDKTNWIGQAIPQTGPFVISLWFVRDLMVATLCAPVLYWLFKKTKVWGLLLLLFCFVSKIWPQIHGFTIESIFFFGNGLYLSMYGKGLVEEARKLRNTVLIVGLITFIIGLYFGGIKTAPGRIVFPFFAVCCVWSYVNLGAYLTNNKGIQISSFLIKSSFFVYVLHACPIGYFRSIISQINTFVSGFVAHLHIPWIVYYLISPFVIVAFCLLIYYIMERWLPHTCSLLTGNRNPSQVKK